MTPDQAFDRAFQIVWRIENGGDKIVATNQPGDRGGYTRGGIALNRHPELSRAQLDAMTAPDFAIWYRANYWTPHACDALPWPLNLIVYDGEVNQGGEGAEALQQALGVKIDGNIGPVTLAAVARQPLTSLCALTMAAREQAYRNDPDFVTFGHGWITRLFIVAFSAALTPG